MVKSIVFSNFSSFSIIDSSISKKDGSMESNNMIIKIIESKYAFLQIYQTKTLHLKVYYAN